MLVCEVRTNRKKIILSVTYRQHYDSKTELDSFIVKYKEMCQLVSAENPLCSLHIGDLNCRSSEFWSADVDNDAGNLLVSVLDDTGLQQLVHEPTHMINNSKSCIDLAITDQPNLINCIPLATMPLTIYCSILIVNPSSL